MWLILTPSQGTVSYGAYHTLMLPEFLPYPVHHLSDCLLHHLHRMVRRPREGSSSATWSCCMVHLSRRHIVELLNSESKLSDIHHSKVFCASVCHNNLHLREVAPGHNTMEDNLGFTVVKF
jgi:hypothetical protein